LALTLKRAELGSAGVVLAKRVRLVRLLLVVPDTPDLPQLREVSATAIRQPREGLKIRRWAVAFMMQEYFPKDLQIRPTQNTFRLS
jgi:hypothetical protein